MGFNAKDEKRVCRICENSDNNKKYVVREMMFGTKEEFEYFQCSACECLQITDFPAEVSSYYESQYHSFKTDPSQYYRHPVSAFARRQRDRYTVFNKGLLGRWLSFKYPAFDGMKSLSALPVSGSSKILDVGCGAGCLLYFLREIGIKHVLGIDPHLEKDIEYKNGLKILKKEISGVENRWDLIMFHHSFEHVKDPKAVLENVSRLLADHGFCLIRIPTVSSDAWDRYGIHWVQLDAPRHFYLHSIASIKRLAEEVNLTVDKIEYDSDAFQFWGSEQYLQNISLKSERSYDINPSNSLFSEKDIEDFKQRAKKLNENHRGDQAAFYLKKN